MTAKLGKQFDFQMQLGLFKALDPQSFCPWRFHVFLEVWKRGDWRERGGVLVASRWRITEKLYSSRLVSIETELCRLTRDFGPLVPYASYASYA